MLRNSRLISVFIKYMINLVTNFNNFDCDLSSCPVPNFSNLGCYLRSGGISPFIVYLEIDEGVLTGS